MYLRKINGVFFKIFFFWCGPFLKSLLNLLQYCFCFMLWIFGPEACEILAPWPRIEPALPALEGEVLTTGPPGKSQMFAVLSHCFGVFGSKNELTWWLVPRLPCRLWALWGWGPCPSWWQFYSQPCPVLGTQRKGFWQMSGNSVRRSSAVMWQRTQRRISWFLVWCSL